MRDSKVGVFLGRTLVLFGLVLGLQGCDNGSPAQKKAQPSASLVSYKILIDWTNEPTYLGVYYARSLGLFAKLGLNVTIDQAQGANQAVNAVATGSYPIATASGGATVLARNSGANVVSLGVLYPRISTVIYGLATTPIRAPKDLYNHKIGIYPGSITKNEFDAFVARNKLDAGKMDVVSLSGSDISLLLSGTVDAALNYGEMSPVVLANNASVRQVGGQRIFEIHLADTGVVGYGLNVITSRMTLAANRVQVSAVAAAVFEGYRQGCLNQSAATAAFTAEFPEKDPVYVRNSWALVCQMIGKNPGKQTALGWQQTIDVYHSLHLLSVELKPADVTP